MELVRELLESKGQEVFSVPEDVLVLEALKLMAKHDIGALPVIQGDRIIGIFSERDYARVVVNRGRSSDQVAVGDLMIQDIVSVSPSDTLEMCIALMIDRKIRHLPVLDVDRLVGILTLGDVITQLVPRLQKKVQELENLLAGRD
jgi:CBS domain-containing protein